MKVRFIIIGLMMLLAATAVRAQITIGGNVYGGGNAGDVDGNTTVTLYAGDLNRVFGGARMANVGGHALVNLDGERASSYILINQVYGGNDISGTIGKDLTTSAQLPFTPEVNTSASGTVVDGSWSAYMRISTKTKSDGTPADDAQKIYIGQLFGGGNGDYQYSSVTENNVTTHVLKDSKTGTEILRTKDNIHQPDLRKIYLELLGGSIVNVFGGGNSANVKESTVIHLDNPSEVVNHIYVKDGKEVAEGTTGAVDLLVEERFKKMGFNYKFTYPNSGAFQIGNLFGGNNKVDMAIQPKWNLLGGKVRNLYSGGNEGRMICSRGLLLQIPENSTLTVDNVYGGCRKADVRPLDDNGKDMVNAQIQLESNPTGIPAGFAARTRILGGNINNVYGGNDISGNVYGGNTVAILTTIHGNVYGGGNGSYAYTDNTALKNELLWRDFYYDPDEVFTKAGVSPPSDSRLKSVEALNLVRPNAEQVSLLLRGTVEKPVFVEGAVFVGGNSASLREITPTEELNDGIRKVEVKIGSHVTADQLFLGNNGENMVNTDEEVRDATDGLVTPEGALRTIANTTIAGNGSKFNSMILTDPVVFDKYMEGCAMKVMPRVVFDDVENYDEYTARFGSFYCGGNVGSMQTDGLTVISFNDKAIIYDKVVGGCNTADVDAVDGFNAAYRGGLLGNPDDNGDKLKLNFSGLKIQPKRWLRDNEDKLVLDTKGNPQLIWNTIDVKTRQEVSPVTAGSPGNSSENDLNRRLLGGNIYGGCYTSGHVNGNVIINIDATLVDPDVLFDKVKEDSYGEAVLYGDNVLEQSTYHIEERRTGVILGQQGMDVLGSALNVFGGGKGKATEIWGSTTVNLNKGYTFQIFGGSEEGVIGKSREDKGETVQSTDYEFNGKHYVYSRDYSCYVNLKGDYAGVTKTSTDNHPDMADCEFIYGGGFLGPICGNTTVNLGKGRIFNSFAGSCNADILGHTETYMGRQINSDGTSGEGFPYVRDYIYGGNDMGGRILNTADFTSRVRTASTMLHSTDMPKNVSSYVEYVQGRAIGIFGGCFGTYDYTDPEYKDFFYTTGSDGQTSANLGTARPGYTKPRMNKAFVNFRPTDTDDLKNKATNTISEIYGAGQGYPGDADRDIMQKSSYILIDIPQTMENYKHMEVWGAGAWSGLGMETYVNPNTTDVQALNAVSAVIDLPRGKIAAAYGGSYQEGVTRRTVVNVPAGSTLQVGSIFGGAYGTNTYMPCDVYEANVNWKSGDAVLLCDPVRTDDETKSEVGDDRMKGAIFGGNNNKRRTLYGKVNINVPMKQKHWKSGMTLGTVYGAGCGGDTWAEYTEVNLESGAQVYEVYGGGQAGKVHNAESVQYYMNLDKPDYTWPEGYARAGQQLSDAEWKAAWRLGGGYDPSAGTDPNTNQPYTYWENTNTNLANPLTRTAEMDDRDFSDLSVADKALVQNKYNTNVIIKKGATVENYAYGGGLGEEAVVAGTTYITLLGGTVKKDIYAAGTSGAVQDLHGADVYSSGNRAGFMASANVYIAGGTCRNVYGGGWKGSVGRHVKDDGTGKMIEADINESAVNDISGETHVVIGIRKDQTDANLLSDIRKVVGSTAVANDYGFYCGVPTIQRNAYGGGEGGAVYGAAHLTINNGYIGYDYIVPDGSTVGTYVEKINDETYYENEKYAGDNRLRDCGNVFGGGYDARSSVDESNIKIWGGMIRGSLHGGGEIATIGRGSTKESGEVNSVREFENIYKAGKTHIEMYNGHVKRNVFGGGKGYNLLGYGSNSDLYTDGYTFGQTEVYIHGGEIGTEAGVADNYGNVFGGGDLGYVYSKGYSNAQSRKTDTGSPGHKYYYTTPYKCTTAYGKYKVDDIIDETTYKAMSSTDQKKWTAQTTSLVEDCKVVVAPYLQVKKDGTPVSYNNKTYNAYDYVPTDYLNTLPKAKDDSRWSNLILSDDDSGERGVTIHNAVFGGGNVSSNSDTHYANATTVYGNTTATLCDVYHRDFITVGYEHTGGFYGGGNLSVVDGYRELNITNYGTDYYNMDSRVSLDDYHNKLTNRERAYFKLEYECQTANNNYNPGEKISEEDYNALDSEYKNETYWKQYGFCSIYAGRLLNTIQRADFCGVFGSRMVLQGSKDRVADVGEKIDYTINRVGELSLNKQKSMANDTNAKDATHGNYFGIYSIVNYLGNLTSDVRMKDYYVDEKGDQSTTKSFYSYKASKPQDNWRNRGTSLNEVALASGVFLELTTENSTADHKDYGYITGVVQLDLINVKKEIQGGGFVYAKNEHRIPVFYEDKPNVILSDFNKEQTTAHDAAKTYKRYRYSATYDDGPNKGQSNAEDWPTGDGFVIDGETAYALKEIQTSGNFIHQSKRIVDDCYPTNNAYTLNVDPYSEAHYWYIKGSVYIYDQKVSAYTGSATAYSKEVHLPLTITAASHGKLKLLNVKQNRYAYYAPTSTTGTDKAKIGSFKDNNDKVVDKVWVNKQADGYELNDVITWWDWQNLPLAEQAYFVDDTYVNAEACIIGGTPYSVGEYVMLPEEYTALKTNTPVITDAAGHAFEAENGQALEGSALVEYVFRSSNNISHNTGYVLTLDMDTPKEWDSYYTKATPAGDAYDKISKEAYKILTDKSAYLNAPTFTPNSGEADFYVLGKRQYTAGQVITKADYDFALESGDGSGNMEEAYVATKTVSYTYNGTTKTTKGGAAIGKTEYDYLGTSGQSDKQSAFVEAKVCTNTLELGKDNYLLKGDLKTADEITAMKAITPELVTDDEIDAALSKAYICTETGLYGGRKYVVGKNYTALQSWSDLTKADRDNLTYNYDALDLLVDPDYTVDPEASEEAATSTKSIYHEPYSKTLGVEYDAVFKGYEENGVAVNTYTYDGGSVAKDHSIPSDVFETKVPNYKRFYSKVTQSDIYLDEDTESPKKYFYISTANFIYDGEPYGIGQIVSKDVYQHNASKVNQVETNQNGPFYYCYEAHDETHDEEDGEGGTTVVVEKVKVGKVITENAFKQLRNDQKYFVIQGQEPTETTTFYVNRESDIKDVTKEKVITVVYQYTYYEQDDDEESGGGAIKMTNELHVVNIHLQLESGVPTIGILENPPTVLPGNTVGMKNPTVTPGTYEVLTNGYELFDNKTDAEHHRNGVEFKNNNTPVYWYQNGDHYLAFYSKTYLGKTYSNYVPLSVANYHDLADIMENHQDNHLYIDRADVDRPCKVYINDYSVLKSDDPRKDKNGLDELKDLFDLSVLDASTVERDENGIITTVCRFKGHALLGDHISGTANLEFILRSDLDRTKPADAAEWTEWTPLGNATKCFGGNVHGDGHHVSGLEASLFGELCGNVYNLGVTGSFNTAGVADTGDGFVENCWIKTTATTAAAKPFAVFGNPSDGTGTQLVNCYYPKSNKDLYSTETCARGNARMMDDHAFYNGEVTYDLNGFYLGKRYYDGIHQATGKSYDFLSANIDGTLPTTTTPGYYPEEFAIYPLTGTVKEGDATGILGYVENRFYDGDFRYADGTIPETFNIRRQESEPDASGNTTVTWAPIWPDDYLFFGQRLNYGHVDGQTHQERPSVIYKLSDRIVTTAVGNRVFRAPAYFRSKEMQAAHFNPYAVFAQTKKDDATTVAYKGMTAIDFTGGNGDVNGGYKNGLQGDKFYPPLLDDGGLSAFQNVDLTKNLLAYAYAKSDGTATTAAEQTANVVSSVLHDYPYAEGTATGNGYVPGKKTYHTVAPWDRTSNWENMHGHWVQGDATRTTYTAINDHFLVDKQDFNCPISYTFNKDKRMWYQRIPDTYVDRTKGWEGISIPFEAEWVTTDVKGEITHFYNRVVTGTTPENETIGHEYWLRTFTDVGSQEENDVVTANFTYPDEGTIDKENTNTFLWDYYYSYNEYYDANRDNYQGIYYSDTRIHKNYPRLAETMPYIIGFPSATYYEFDLSGTFSPKNTASWPGNRNLKAQTITFASAKGITIGVSDTDITSLLTSANKPTHGDYTFMPSFMKQSVTKGYVMSADGGSYDVVPDNTSAEVEAFRPYFVKTSGNGVRTRSIIFSNEESELKGVEQHGDPRKEEINGGLRIWTKKDKIFVESTLSFTEDMRVVSAAGITVAAFVVEPGQTVEVQADFSGLYIVHTLDGKYTKKVAVRK